jgi:hypothetical protein
LFSYDFTSVKLLCLFVFTRFLYIFKQWYCHHCKSTEIVKPSQGNPKRKASPRLINKHYVCNSCGIFFYRHHRFPPLKKLNSSSSIQHVSRLHVVSFQANIAASMLPQKLTHMDIDCLVCSTRLCQSITNNSTCSIRCLQSGNLIKELLNDRAIAQQLRKYGAKSCIHRKRGCNPHRSYRYELK